MIEISNCGRYSQRGSPFRVTPYMQEQMAWSGQLLVYEDASEMLRRVYRLDVEPSQIFRVSEYYGCLLEEDLYKEVVVMDDTKSAEDCLYVEVDGSMVLTDEKYKEVKVGRTFWQSDCRERRGKEERGQITRSDYAAQLTDCEQFIELFEPRLAAYRHLKERMVFINDGATWIDKWIKDKFPDATQILDFFHLTERLSKLAVSIFDTETTRKQWLEEQRQSLLEGQAKLVLERLKNLPASTSDKEEQRQTTINYLQNNLHRVDYKAYRERGLFIGSGAIESAHRTLIQDRMKRSGQRWSVCGANCMINLRVCYKSDRWNLVTENIRIMNNAIVKNAA